MTPQAGTVQTVLGSIQPEQVGRASTHEHLLVDMLGRRPFAVPSPAEERGLALAPVSLANLWWVRQNYTRSRANVVLDDEEQALAETRRFAAVGGGTLVDATPADLGRDPAALARLSESSGVHIVMGAGHYVATHHPAELAGEREEAIAERLVRDVRVGADGTTIRSGILGEIGCSWPPVATEQRVLRAAARAQRQTGVSVIVHTGRDQVAPIQHARVLDKLGVPPDRIVLAHIDRRLRPGDRLRELAKTGCYLALDCFGLEPWLSPETATMPMPCDRERIEMILWLADAGFIDQVTVAQDVAMKHRLSCYGGHGYDHLLRNIAPLLAARGLGQDGVDRLLVTTPRRILPINNV